MRATAKDATMQRSSTAFRWPAFACGLALAALALAPEVRAQTVADFYRGKTVNMLIGVPPGGEYDLHARLIARHIGRHIPGNSNVVAQNMVGATGIKMANFLYQQAPRDGTYIGVIQNALPASQAVGLEGIGFDAAKFRWLGTIAPGAETLAVWHTTGVKTIEDARKRDIIIGATARSGIVYTFPAMMNEFFGTKFKIVTGYAGGNQMNLAMERGEIEARNNTWSSWKTTKPAWLAEKKIAVIAQVGPRAVDLDAPLLEDLAKDADERAVIEVIASAAHLGRPVTLNPGVPEERVAAMRAAFMDTMKDPAFLADAAALNFEVAPFDGPSMQRFVEKLMQTPNEIAARSRHLME
jgi:tripartite-type tricarboxylate transporter receptor subunit TctC